MAAKRKLKSKQRRPEEREAPREEAARFVQRVMTLLREPPEEASQALRDAISGDGPISSYLLVRAVTRSILGVAEREAGQAFGYFYTQPRTRRLMREVITRLRDERNAYKARCEGKELEGGDIGRAYEILVRILEDPPDAVLDLEQERKPGESWKSVTHMILALAETWREETD